MMQLILKQIPCNGRLSLFHLHLFFPNNLNSSKSREIINITKKNLRVCVSDLFLNPICYKGNLQLFFVNLILLYYLYLFIIWKIFINFDDNEKFLYEICFEL